MDIGSIVSCLSSEDESWPEGKSTEPIAEALSGRTLVCNIWSTCGFVLLHTNVSNMVTR